MYKQEAFKENLIDWFDENQRQMPWRETSDPYAIWVSEVMLQQTQVDTVRDYYKRFMDRFPHIMSLAEAQEDEVLKYWEGLGYYSRARNFHIAAKEVVNHYGGVIPKDPQQFKALKGVGPYTQAAVLSIAFDTPLPTVDGNVFRVWSRLNNDWLDTALPQTRKTYELQLKPYVKMHSGTFNQAMMELGALICTPKAPLCLFCPVQVHCEAYHEGTVLELPVKTKKMKKASLDMDVYIIQGDSGDYLIEKRQERLLNGMWQFPLFNKSDGIDTVKKRLGNSFKIERENIYRLKHQFTHMTWNLKVHIATLSNDDLKQLPNQYRLMSLDEKQALTFPVPMTKIFNAIQ
ncbi:A/G-specific adenine glycosylase [Staphylococcus felis]|uniref:A/G-specific adenine glycosylase n=1 Tax=Staphylococcus felis TaxID=46127 RepID=UPI000E23FA32|nr:A/G-specific adenine glycosylase [Staphylococcus felis]REH77868.1 A/G-specific adenine glycosylase [Staphylococcus felis]REH98843.1 A/G-specific adenine glycosylase [Staphylococcus felis]REI06148.1 A/G-specific adenine glycosylase [Staphylococcus felis]REI29664.1 A/G-specific adenine glycosylase [Staphylococcus felis]